MRNNRAFRRAFRRTQTQPRPLLGGMDSMAVRLYVQPRDIRYHNRRNCLLLPIGGHGRISRFNAPSGRGGTIYHAPRQSG